LACRLATGRPKQNNAKLGQKELIRGHVTYFLKFWYSLYISGTVDGYPARSMKTERFSQKRLPHNIDEMIL